MFLYGDLSLIEENVLLFLTLSVSQYWCNFSLWWTGWLLLVSVTLTYRLTLCCLSQQPTCPNWKTIPVAKRQKLKWYWHSKTPRNFLLKVKFYSWASLDREEDFLHCTFYKETRTFPLSLSVAKLNMQSYKHLNILVRDFPTQLHAGFEAVS